MILAKLNVIEKLVGMELKLLSVRIMGIVRIMIRVRIIVV